MKPWLEEWEARCAAAPALRFVDVNLRGVGQVMFQDNPMSGLLFLAAVAWGSFAGGVPAVFGASVLGVIVATLTAMWLRVDTSALHAGLMGYNGVLVGAALATFIAPSAWLWVYVALGAAISVVTTLATANALKPYGVAALTAPFVLVTWILLLATHSLGNLAGTALPDAALATPIESVAATRVGVGEFVQGVARSISQVFLKGSAVAALLLLAGLAVNSLAAVVAALGGAILAVLVAHALGAESDLVTAGLLGFSPVLTAVAVATVFNAPGGRVIAYAALGTAFTVIAQLACNVALAPLGIPALTAPFVLVSWIFLLPKAPANGAS